jgi:hypothetical protein
MLGQGLEYSSDSNGGREADLGARVGKQWPTGYIWPFCAESQLQMIFTFFDVLNKTKIIIFRCVNFFEIQNFSIIGT